MNTQKAKKILKRDIPNITDEEVEKIQNLIKPIIKILIDKLQKESIKFSDEK